MGEAESYERASKKKNETANPTWNWIKIHLDCKNYLKFILYLEMVFKT
jgi:hypothetical protein